MNGCRRLVYFAPTEPGGLNEYAAKQVAALVELGYKISCVASPHLIPKISHLDCDIVELRLRKVASRRLERSVEFLRCARDNIRQLVQVIDQTQVRHVLFSAYAEYFAPLWVGQLCERRGRGVRFGVVVHDPVRDFVVGPRWWHRYSIKSAYSFVDVAFVHEEILLSTGLRRQIPVCVIPQGLYEYPVVHGDLGGRSLREKLDVPDGAIVLLCFGHIRDDKNLHLAIQCLGAFENVYLLVAGRPQSSGQRPVAYYQDLARKHRVHDRCRWVIGFIPDGDVEGLFLASDFVVLLYSSKFRSASAVLNATVQFRRPVLASSGESPLRRLVQSFELGVWVSPDSLSAALEGIRQLMAGEIHPRWADFSAANSWRENARLVGEGMFA